MSIKAQGTLSSVSVGNAAIVDQGWASMACWGSFTATVSGEISLDGGVTWIPLKLTNGAGFAPTTPAVHPVFIPVDGAQIRWSMTAWTVGTLSYRIDQN